MKPLRILGVVLVTSCAATLWLWLRPDTSLSLPSHTPDKNAVSLQHSGSGYQPQSEATRSAPLDPARRQISPEPASRTRRWLTVVDESRAPETFWSPRMGPLTINIHDRTTILDHLNYSKMKHGYAIDDLPPNLDLKAVRLLANDLAQTSIRLGEGRLEMRVRRLGTVYVALAPAPPSDMLEALTLRAASEVSDHVIERPVRTAELAFHGLRIGENYIFSLHGAPTNVIRSYPTPGQAPGLLGIEIDFRPYVVVTTGEMHDGWVGAPALPQGGGRFDAPMQYGHAWIPIDDMDEPNRQVFGWGDGWSFSGLLPIHSHAVGQVFSANVQPSELHRFRLTGASCDPSSDRVSVRARGRTLILSPSPLSESELICAWRSRDEVWLCNWREPGELRLRCTHGYVILPIPSKPTLTDIRVPEPYTQRSPHKPLIYLWSRRYGVPSAYMVLVQQKIPGDAWLPIWSMHLHKPDMQQLESRVFEWAVMPEVEYRIILRAPDGAVVEASPLFE